MHTQYPPNSVCELLVPPYDTHCALHACDTPIAEWESNTMQIGVRKWNTLKHTEKRRGGGGGGGDKEPCCKEKMALRLQGMFRCLVQCGHAPLQCKDQWHKTHSNASENVQGISRGAEDLQEELRNHRRKHHFGGRPKPLGVQIAVVCVVYRKFRRFMGWVTHLLDPCVSPMECGAAEGPA